MCVCGPSKGGHSQGGHCLHKKMSEKGPVSVPLALAPLRATRRGAGESVLICIGPFSLSFAVSPHGGTAVPLAYRSTSLPSGVREADIIPISGTLRSLAVQSEGGIEANDVNDTATYFS